MRTIVVLPYDPKWAEAFSAIHRELDAALTDLALTIEHVGSTSVPGLWAKPIIDVDIVIAPGQFERVNEALAATGYAHEGDRGIAGREAFKYEGKHHLMPHHLYVCEDGSAELLRHIALRDFLRTHKAERDAYSRVKLEMAQKHPHDIDLYIAGKEPVVLDIYRKCGLFKP